MIIIAEDAESKLLSMLLQHTPATTDHFCCFLAFKGYNLTKAQIFDAVTDSLKRVSSFSSIHFFLCDNGDAFLMNMHWQHKQFLEAATLICDVLEIYNMAACATCYDIVRDINKIMKIIQDRKSSLRKGDIQRLKKMKYERDKIVQAEIISALDDSLVQSLDTRRQQRSRPSILIVDDDRVCRTLAAHIISPFYTPHVSIDGASAITAYVDHAPDVLFLDIGLPDISGHSILESIFTVDPNAYVIMFSGRKDRENILRAMEYGARGYIGKPFTQGAVMDYIASSPFVRQKQQRMNSA